MSMNDILTENPLKHRLSEQKTLLQGKK